MLRAWDQDAAEVSNTGGLSLGGRVELLSLPHPGEPAMVVCHGPWRIVRALAIPNVKEGPARK